MTAMDTLAQLFAAGHIIQPGAPLATPGQRLVESRALAILGRPELDAARDRIATLFGADRNAKLADQHALIAQSVAEHVVHGALVAASETPRTPRFVWTIALAREWLGQLLPGSRIGQDNPDNVYRFASVDPAFAYRISGCFPGPEPRDFSICALPAQVGEGIAANVRGIITRDSLDVDAEGRFEIDVDASASDGRRNHLCIAGARVLMVRDTLADWGVELPSYLRIDPIDAAGNPVVAEDDFDPAAVAARAAELATGIAEFFLDRVQHGMCEVAPLHTVPPPVSSAGRGGLVTQSATLGYYRRGDGEAWVLDIDPMGARYLGVQICDMWMLSYDYSLRTSCFNHRQALADADGRYRLVVSAADPGVHNWLDGGGHPVGTILLRWQGIPAGADFAGAVTTRVVRLADLPRALPPETRFLDAAGRAAQRAERLAAYRRRLTGDNPQQNP